MTLVRRNASAMEYKESLPLTTSCLQTRDDMSLLTQNSVDMQRLLQAVQEFEEWSGIPVNTTKTKLMEVDGTIANRTVPVRVTYKDIP